MHEDIARNTQVRAHSLDEWQCKAAQRGKRVQEQRLWGRQAPCDHTQRGRQRACTAAASIQAPHAAGHGQQGAARGQGLQPHRGITQLLFGEGGVGLLGPLGAVPGVGLQVALVLPAGGRCSSAATARVGYAALTYSWGLVMVGWPQGCAGPLFTRRTTVFRAVLQLAPLNCCRAAVVTLGLLLGWLSHTSAKLGPDASKALERPGTVPVVPAALCRGGRMGGEHPKRGWCAGRSGQGCQCRI